MMARKNARAGRRPHRPPEAPEPPQVSEPTDVVDGIPDRSGRPALWKYIVLVLIFVAWVCFLVACGLIGAP